MLVVSQRYMVTTGHGPVTAWAMLAHYRMLMRQEHADVVRKSRLTLPMTAGRCSDSVVKTVWSAYRLLINDAPPALSPSDSYVFE